MSSRRDLNPRPRGEISAHQAARRWRQTESSTQLIAGLRLGQRLAANAIDRGADLVGRALCRRRLVLDYLHRMTMRRIHAEQGCTPLGNLEQKQPAPAVAILEGLVAKGLLQLVELNQLQGQRTTQKLIAVKLNRMLVQGRERLRNRETMVRGKGAHTLVDEVIDGAERTTAITSRKVSLTKTVAP